MPADAAPARLGWRGPFEAVGVGRSYPLALYAGRFDRARESVDLDASDHSSRSLARILVRRRRSDVRPVPCRRRLVPTTRAAARPRAAKASSRSSPPASSTARNGTPPCARPAPGARPGTSNPPAPRPHRRAVHGRLPARVVVVAQHQQALAPRARPHHHALRLVAHDPGRLASPRPHAPGSPASGCSVTATARRVEAGPRHRVSASSPPPTTRCAPDHERARQRARRAGRRAHQGRRRPASAPVSAQRLEAQERSVGRLAELRPPCPAGCASRPSSRSARSARGVGPRKRSGMSNSPAATVRCAPHHLAAPEAVVAAHDRQVVAARLVQAEAHRDHVLRPPPRC